MKCGHPERELAFRKRWSGRAEAVCKACHREYMRAYRPASRKRRTAEELAPVTIWPELARRAW